MNKKENPRFKLCDFGLSDYIDIIDKSPTSGTIGYIAPEIFSNKIFMNGDVFSAGTILFTLLTGYFPFYSKNQKEMYMKNKKAEVVFNEKSWGRISQAGKNMVQLMMLKDPL